MTGKTSPIKLWEHFDLALRRQTVALGLAEKLTGITCVGAQSSFSGRKRWEERQPEAAYALRKLAESHCQQYSTFNSTIAYTRLTAAEALNGLIDQGFSEEQLLGKSTMAIVLNSMGYRLRKVIKAKPQKKIPETDAIFDNIKTKDLPSNSGRVRRLSLDSKATVKIGNYSRGGRTRGAFIAYDHDMGCKETYIPCGMVDEDSGQLYITFGSSYKTSDLIVDVLEQWWEILAPIEKQRCEVIQIKMDNGSESSGARTQFLKRMVEFCDQTGKSIQLLYYPPYHSKYN
ncbi:MAG: ISAzo13 family transposase [Oscillatoria sp. SIO1A7]|nr:ISAzo13 family transposase [Oscillatoria sp. SIO1A7]